MISTTATATATTNTTASKRTEKRSATFRVQGLVWLFPFLFLTSIAARFIEALFFFLLFFGRDFFVSFSFLFFWRKFVFC